MLILIGEGLEGQIAAICQNGSIPQLRGITNLLQSHADGKHIVVAPPDICRCLEESEKLSHEQQATAKRIRSRYSELSALLDTFSIYAEVSIAGASPVKNGGIWTIPMDWIALHGLDAANLICEDLYDCQICLEAAEDYLSVNDLNKLSLALDGISGGGGNTHRVLESRAVERQKLSLCVVDSDRETPSADAQLGETAKKCTQVKGSGLFEVLMTPGRELENHIPFRLIDKVRNAWHGSSPSESFARFEKRRAGIGLHADLKKGIKKFNVEKMIGDTRQFWNDVMADMPHCSIECCAPICSKENSGDCTQVILQPLGNSLMKDVRDFLIDPARGKKNKRHQKYLPSPNDEFWKDLGKKVSEYGISMKATRGM